MARSLIRLPQLDGATVPDQAAAAFEFKKEGAGAELIMKFDTQANEIVMGDQSDPQSLRVSGDLFVTGNTVYASTSQLLVQDKIIAAAIPDAELVTDVGNSEGFVLSSNTLTVTFDRAHGLSANQYVYLVSDSLPEDVYQVASISGTSGQEEVFTVTTSGISDFAREDGTFSASITDANSDGAGFMIPTIAGLVGLRFDDASDNLEITGKDFKVVSSSAATSNSTGALQVAGGAGIVGALHVGGLADIDGALTVGGAVNIDDTTSSTSNTSGALIVDGGLGLAENLNMGGDLDVDGDSNLNGNVNLGNAAGDLISIQGTVQQSGGEFMDIDTAGANNISLNVASNGSGSDVAITFPANDGTVAVAVDTVEGGLALSATGIISMDIAGMATALTGAAASGSDQIMVDDGGVAKSMTLTELQAFLAAGGTAKESMVLNTQITLSGGNAVVEYDGTNQSAAALGDSDFRTALGTAAESSREVFLNGILMREGASNDFQIDDASKEFRFKFQLEADDVITVMVRS